MGLVRESIEIIAVRASRNPTLFNKKKGTWPSESSFSLLWIDFTIASLFFSLAGI